MAQNQAARWLITYDIAHPRRLARVFKRLKKAGVPVQYSVFSVEGSAALVGTLMAELAGMIDKREDDVRAYRLPAEGWQTTLGASILPDHLWIE